MAFKKKAARRRSYGTRKASRRSGNKKSMFKLIKGAVYVGSIVAPAYTAYEQLGGGKDGAIGTAKCFAFMNPTTGAFDFASGAQVWTPVVVVAAVDFITTKLPVQRAISRGLRNIF
jgi:hypothetical protein